MVLKFGRYEKLIRNTWKVLKYIGWRRMEQIIWVDRVRNEEVLHSQGRQECSAYDRKKEG